MREEMRGNYIMRLQSGMCTVDPGLILVDMLTAFEKIGDFCYNITAGRCRNQIDMETKDPVKKSGCDRCGAMLSLFQPFSPDAGPLSCIPSCVQWAALHGRASIPSVWENR